MNEVLQNIKARRSVRAYTDRQVSAQDLDLILEAAAYAPNGMHYETWHFTALPRVTNPACANADRVKPIVATITPLRW